MSQFINISKCFMLLRTLVLHPVVRSITLDDLPTMRREAPANHRG